MSLSQNLRELFFNHAALARRCHRARRWGGGGPHAHHLSYLETLPPPSPHHFGPPPPVVFPHSTHTAPRVCVLKHIVWFFFLRTGKRTCICRFFSFHSSVFRAAPARALRRFLCVVAFPHFQLLHRAWDKAGIQYANPPQLLFEPALHRWGRERERRGGRQRQHTADAKRARVETPPLYTNTSHPTHTTRLPCICKIKREQILRNTTKTRSHGRGLDEKKRASSTLLFFVFSLRRALPARPALQHTHTRQHTPWLTQNPCSRSS